MKFDELTFFHEGTRRICGSLDMEEMLASCLRFLKKFIPIEWIDMSIYDPQIGGIRILARATDIDITIPVDEPILLSAETRAYIESHTGKATLIGSAADSPASREIAVAFGIREVSAIALSLAVKGERLGVVGVGSRQKNRFTIRHKQILQLLYDPFAIALSNHLRYREVMRLKEVLSDDNRYLHRELHRISGDEIVGENFGLLPVMEMVRQVAPLDSHVLLLGETGVGKEVIANTIHYSSNRRNGPLIKVNCGAIPEGLLDSELFGHEKGAFTGAVSTSRGRFERAAGGTIFLDEVGELPPAAQVRLLRVLQEKTFERVGGEKPIPADVRVIAATHRDLEQMVKQGEFRQDLWYRLNVFPIVIPPLRDRKADIPAFVYYFLEHKLREMNLRSNPVLAPGSLERLQAYDWPGNVRELENIVERELIRSQKKDPGEPMRFDSVGHPLMVPKAAPATRPMAAGDPSLDLASMERAHIINVLQLAGGKVQGQHGAADVLGINPSTLRHRMRKLKIPFGRKAETAAKTKKPQRGSNGR